MGSTASEAVSRIRLNVPFLVHRELVAESRAFGMRVQEVTRSILMDWYKLRMSERQRTQEERR